MGKIFLIILLVAFYYFTNISYTPSDSGKVIYIKTANEWKFYEYESEKTKLNEKFYFNFFISAGLNENKDTAKKLQFSYISK